MKKIVFFKSDKKENIIMAEKQGKLVDVDIESDSSIEKIVSTIFYTGASRRHEAPIDPTYSAEYFIKQYSQTIQENCKPLGSPTQPVAAKSVSSPIGELERAIIAAAIDYRSVSYDLQGTGKKDIPVMIQRVEEAKANLWKAIESLERNTKAVK